ncbi:uncharacterized protein LOC142564844 isoform X1 [Dermacentor variabilis]|uniref:uncharacterized protein LOC142564844 isoform X1 n=1 Tax=Dermacentor variabilis TaxID=34621 RepID=UPI003F5B03DC
MDTVPNEVLLPILALVDGASLVRCKRVCKRWHVLVEAILQHSHVLWKMICQSEIDPDVLAELLDQSCPEDESGGVEVDWFKVYKRWYSTSAVSKFSHRIRMLHCYLRDVTCLKASGDVIVSGHNTGYIIVWNAWGGWQVLSIKASGDAISDLALFNLHGPATLHPGPSCYKRAHILCAPHEPLLNAYSLEDGGSSCMNPARTVYPIVSMKICGDLLATLTLVRCVVSVMRLTLTGGNLQFQPLLSSFLQEGACSWIGLNKQCVFHMGPQWLAGKAVIANQARETWQLAPVDRGEPLHVTLALVQRQGIFVIATVDMRLYISMDAGHQVREIVAARRWNGRVTALALRGPLLVIGLDSGWLCVYRVQDLLLDLESRLPDWSQQLDRDPIIAVDVTSEPDTPRPVVAAATRHHRYVVTWPFRSVSSVG